MTPPLNRLWEASLVGSITGALSVQGLGGSAATPDAGARLRAVSGEDVWWPIAPA
jgi:hypothetical protein